MEIGTIVQHKETGNIGVVALNIMGACSPGEEPIVYDGTDVFCGTDRDELEVIDTYDPSVADPDKCGAGEGEKTCKYLSFEPEAGDCVCSRFSAFRNQIIMSNMVAQGSPKGLYPKCQEEIQEAIQASE